MDKGLFATRKNDLSFSAIFKKSWKSASFFYIFAAMFLFYVIVNAQYINWGSITNILTHTAVIGTLSLGMGLIIISGDIDLSVGANFAFSGGMGILAYNEIFKSTGSHVSALLLSMVVIVAISAVIGFINGFMIGKVKMPAFIATLGTMLIFRSLCKYILKAIPTEGGQQQQTYQVIDYYNSPFYKIGNDKVATIPIVGIILIILVLLVFYFSKYTKFGRKIYAIGSNSKASSLAGINVPWTKIIVFTIAGVLIGLSAILHISIYSSMDSSTAGQSYELYAIASCVIGGISMTGGRGNIIGILFGALSFQIIDKIISALSLNPLINDTIKGVILLLAVVLQLVIIEKGAFKKFLQKFGIIYNPNEETLITIKHFKKVNKIKNKHKKEIDKVLSNQTLSKEEIESKVNEILDAQDAELELLNAIHEVALDDARLRFEENERIELIKKEMAKNEVLIQEKINENKTLIEKVKYENMPYQLPILEVEKKCAQELYDLKVKLNAEIDAKKNDVSLLLNNAQHILDRDLANSQLNPSEVQTKYDKKMVKIDALLAKNEAKAAMRDEKLNNQFNASMQKIDELIDKNVALEEEQIASRDARINKLKEKEAIKASKEEAKKAKEEDLKNKELALKASQKERAELLETIVEKRK